MQRQGMMSARHYPLLATLMATLTGACAMEPADDLQLRAAAPGAAVGELEEMDEEPEFPAPEDAAVPCSLPDATLANNCSNGIEVTTCYKGKNGSRGVCDVIDCDESFDALYRCEGDALFVDGKHSCRPHASDFEDCTEVE